MTTPTQISMDFERDAQVSSAAPVAGGCFADDDAYMDMLNASGWEQIGQESCFAKVFAKDGVDYVVKVSAVTSGRPTVVDGWFSFARWAMAKVGQDVAVHLPTIFFLGVFNYKTPNEFFVSHIERLEEKSAQNRFEHQDIVAQGRGDDGLIDPDQSDTLIHKLMVQLRDAFAPTWQFDLHDGNTMTREADGKLVVIDPLSFRDGPAPRGPTGKETAGLMVA